MESGIPVLGANRLYERHEGGLLSRALGAAVHALFQNLAQLLTTQPLDAARAALSLLAPRIAAEVRAIGIDAQQANRTAAQALDITLKAAADPLAQWILAPHAEAANEVRWTGVVDGRLRTVQVDRVFRAALAPKAADDGTWWIIDYKTAHEDTLDPAAALPELRCIFAPQIEAYAKVFRNLHGADAPLRGGLYYPRMSLLDWWEL
jgi:ATP-dependent exoDNAse (exonuclease V) beta subunit